MPSPAAATNERGLDADIIVAGAGPSGLVVSCEAALAGARVLTLDKRNGPTWARAGNLMPRPLELFACRGLIDRVMQRAKELHRDPTSARGIWAGLPGLDYDKVDSDYRYALFLAQIETEKLLAEHLVAIGGEVRLQHEVLGFEQDGKGVRVEVRGADGTVRLFRARYLVGADGNRSAVRQSAGIDWIGHPIKGYAFNVDACIPNPYPRNLTVSHSPTGWAMTYPLSNAVTRFAMIDAHTLGQARTEPPQLDEALAMMRRVFGTDHGVREVQAITQFHDAMYCASRMRQGRVFLVGESVRVHYPASGVGMNFCIQDAFNLGWKLGGVAAGWAREGLLDTYEAERRPELVRFLDNVRRQVGIQFHFDEEHEALKRFLEEEMIPLPEVNRRLCDELAGLNVRYATHGDAHPLAGRHLPNLALRPDRSGGARRVFELLHRQDFALIDFSGEDHGGLPIRSRLRLAAADTVACGARADLQGVAALLLRPDGHIAWVGTQPLSLDWPEQELERWLARSEATSEAA